MAFLGISRALLAGYTKFTYFKSALKKLYFEQIEHEVAGLTASQMADGTKYHENAMQEKISRRAEISMQFSTFVYIKLVLSLCCCLMSWRRRQGWHERKIRALKKFEVACQHLVAETDMVSLLSLQRISKFLQKVSLNRRQRLSVDFFQRYTIKESDLSTPKKNPRGMGVNRIVSECDAENNEVDQRILYEITGIKLQNDAFADDSSFEADLGALVDNLMIARNQEPEDPPDSRHSPSSLLLRPSLPGDGES